MKIEPAQIVVIHDNLEENTPLIISLKDEFDDENVLLYKSSTQGLRYVLDNISRKTIVLLDWDLGTDEPNGAKVIERIREKTSLIYVIIMSANFDRIPADDYIKFVNNDALAITSLASDIIEKIELIKKAENQLNRRVDVVLEEWLSRLSPEERNKPYLTTKSGKTYTFLELLDDIRQGNTDAINVEHNIIYATIDLLARGKRQIND
jgi:DNA-binding NarL/FixJ family response regulator